MLSWQLKLALSEIAPEQYWPEFPGRLNGELELAGQYQPEQGLQLSVPQLALQGELRQLPLRLQGALELSGEQALTRWQFSSPGCSYNMVATNCHCAVSWLKTGSLTQT